MVLYRWIMDYRLELCWVTASSLFAIYSLTICGKKKPAETAFKPNVPKQPTKSVAAPAKSVQSKPQYDPQEEPKDGKKAEKREDEKKEEKKEDGKDGGDKKDYPDAKEQTASQKKKRQEELKKEKEKKIADGFYQEKSDEDDTLEKIKSLEVEHTEKSNKKSQILSSVVTRPTTIDEIKMLPTNGSSSSITKTVVNLADFTTSTGTKPNPSTETKTTTKPNTTSVTTNFSTTSSTTKLPTTGTTAVPLADLMRTTIPTSEATTTIYMPRFQPGADENPGVKDGAMRYAVKDMERVDIKLAVPAKDSFNHPDIRLVARLAVAMVQSKMNKGTPYERIGIYKDRPPTHVDMEFPSMKKLKQVIDARKERVEERNNQPGTVNPDYDGPPRPPNGLPEPLVDNA
ncbi:unnamed protein product, partial [Mesorhabditis belari]|uniref:Uncharacterized protein n=1 Tax=Mesorhabditis belari TaxID=2138241 RepID=A0AAF3F0W6_9BILA